MQTILNAKSKIFGNINPIVLIIFGILFILLGLSLFLLYPRAKNKANLYKEKQLQKYRQVYNKPYAKYEDTNMYLPSWQRMKLFLPVFLGICCLIIGITFLLNL